MPHKSKPQLYRELNELRAKLAEAQQQAPAPLVQPERPAEPPIGLGLAAQQDRADEDDEGDEDGFKVTPLPPGVQAGTGAIAGETPQQETDRERTQRILRQLDDRLAQQEAMDAQDRQELRAGGYDYRGMERWRQFMRRVGRA